MGTSASAHLAHTWIQDTTANLLGNGWEVKSWAHREGTSLMLQMYFISNWFPQLVWGWNSPPRGRTWSFKENTKSAGCKNSPPSFLPSFLWRWFDIAINSYKQLKGKKLSKVELIFWAETLYFYTRQLLCLLGSGKWLHKHMQSLKIQNHKEKWTFLAWRLPTPAPWNSHWELGFVGGWRMCRLNCPGCWGWGWFPAALRSICSYCLHPDLLELNTIHNQGPAAL